MTQSKTLMASRMNRKGSCPVLSGGKSSDNIKGLPIAIGAGRTGEGRGTDCERDVRLINLQMYEQYTRFDENDIHLFDL